MKHYLFVAGNSQACSKSLGKRRNSMEPLCYGLFSVDSEYVRQYQQFGTIYLLVKHFGQGLDVVFMLCQFLLLPIWASYFRNVCLNDSIYFSFQDFALQNLYLSVKIRSKLLANEL